MQQTRLYSSVSVVAIHFITTHEPEDRRVMSPEYQGNHNAGYYYYYYYYLLQLSFHSVAVVLTLVTNKNKYT